MNEEKEKYIRFIFAQDQTDNVKQTMKEILNNEFANVSYDKTGNTIITVWKKPSTSEAYWLIFSLILEKLTELKAKALIMDIFQQGIVGTENRCRIQSEILPAAYRAGLKKIAVVSPNDVFSTFYIENVKNNAAANSINIEFEYFRDLISAQAWVLNEVIAV